MSDCDEPDFYNEHFRTARKWHKCCECETLIDPGDKYVACVGKWDRSVHVYKQHLCCYHIARFVNLDLLSYWPDLPEGLRYAPFREKVREACISFGGIKYAVDEFSIGDFENCVDVLGYWQRWLSGIRETFSEGAGI